ncbi:Dehydrogenase flavoprotein LodB [Enhygromyxa salina]|uniref:Dehydrogenase flavoprotein LodB n=1 Tax=Enhygromyxa salina TaxID=215803 RepID=A0A0C1ZME9_9BACT|nr:FAD-dependent monooxygenase [Enhygromyxa salina]KIG12148.1 Dehydrogenase flavoprotein LodB [Enhygromyxa salina]
MSGLPRYDVVVLGGGPAGCAAALGLARRGVEGVLVVEAGGYEDERIGESIPPDTRALFDQLGVLEGFLGEDHEPCLGSCSSWGADELGYNDFLFNPNGNGWHLDRRRFDAWMAARARDAGVEVWTRAKFVDRLGADERGVELGLQVGDQGAPTRIRAGFVIDATGQRSRYARRCGAQPRTLDRLVVSSGFFELPDAEISRLFRLTMLEAVEEGWWYLARLPRRRVAVAIATSPALHKASRLDRAQGWLAALATTRHILPKLLEAGASPVTGSLTVCAAPSFVLEPVVDTSSSPTWLAVGDAASCFDPISSQGIYKGLSDGLASAQAVAAHLRGDAEALSTYARGVHERFTGYAQQRAYFYGVEQRWTDSTFWRERGGGSERM